MPAVVAPQDDDGVTGLTGFVERVEQAADLRVDVRDAGVVGVDQFRVAVERQRVFAFWNGGVSAQLAPGVAGVAGGVFWRGLEFSRLKLIALVEIPVFFWGDKWQVRLVETDSNKKRLPIIGKFIDLLNRPGRHGAVGVGIVGSVDTFERWAGTQFNRAVFAFFPSPDAFLFDLFERGVNFGSLILQVGWRFPTVGIGQVFVVHEGSRPRGRIFIA